MEVILICLTIVVVFGMFTFIANKYIDKLTTDHDRDALLEALQQQNKKIIDRLGSVEMRGINGRL